MSATDIFGLIGSVIDGRYRVDSVVGEGGFGVVYRGYHLNFRKPIAIKVLKAPGHFTPQARDQFVDKFREEGQMLSQLSDAPGVVRVYDFGVVQSQLLGAAPYLVLEWLEGMTLEAFIAQRRQAGQGPMPLFEAVAMLAPAIDAVAYAHSRKIAHRDIKPANIFLVNTDRGVALKVLDFGIGKAMQEGENANFAATGTKSSFHAFSPLYGAPEQFFSKRFGASGPWTDVHALGLVLCELLVGRPALDGDDAAELLVSSTGEIRPTPRARGVMLPEPVESVFQRAVALSPAHRFPDAQQLLDALRAALAQIGFTVPAAPMSAYSNGAALGAGTGMSSTGPRTPQPSGGDFGAPAAAVGTAAWIADNTSDGLTGPHAPGVVAATYPAMSGGGPAPGYGQPLGVMTAPTFDRPPATVAGGAPPGMAASAQAASGYHGYVAGAGAAAATNVPPQVGISTDAGWAGAGQAPVAAKPPRRSVAPWVLGGLVLVGGGVAAAVVVSSQSSTGGGPSTSSSGTDSGISTAPEVETIEFGRDWTLGSDIFTAAPMVEGDRTGRAHARIVRRGERAQSVQIFRPSGRLSGELRLERGEDGTRTIRVFNARAVQTQVRTITPDGMGTVTARSGVVAWGGCYRKKLTFDDKGHLAEEICLSPTGVPISDENGCQAHRFAHDERHLLVSDGCFALDELGKDPRPTADRGGVHLTKYRYNPQGLRIAGSFYDVMGAATSRLTDGCYGMKFERDEAGNQTSIACVDATGAPHDVLGQAVAMSHWEYDANGCQTRVTYTDVAGKPSGWGPVASELWKMDADCNTLRDESRAANNTLVTMQGSKIAATEYDYDDKGDTSAMRCFGTDGKPYNCTNATGVYGSLARYQRDDRGRQISDKYFSADGTPSRQSHDYPHETRYTYADDGRESSRSFFDDQGKPAPALGGVARIGFRYDALGGLVSTTYFDPEGKPVDSALGCHELRRSYDDRHRIASIECRGTTGGLKVANLILDSVTWPHGAAKVAVLRGEYITDVFYGADDREVSRLDCRAESTPCYR